MEIQVRLDRPEILEPREIPELRDHKGRSEIPGLLAHREILGHRAELVPTRL